LTTLVVMAIGIALPYTPLGPPLEFVPLPLWYWPLLVLTLLAYLLVTQGVKTWLMKRGWL
jgi:Mg2+-importing ATPase